MGSSTLITNDYDNVSGVLKNAIYGNGNTVAYTYDNLNRVTMKRLESNISDYVDTGTQNPEPEPEPEPEPNPDPEKPPVVDPNPKPDPEKPPIITEPHPEKPPLPPKIIDPGPVKPGIPLDPVEPPIEAMSLELENDEPSNNNIDATSNNYTKEIVSARYVYDNVGNLAKLVDSRSGITHKYTYDLSDRLVKTEDSNGNWFKYDYDKTNKTSKKENYIAGKSYSTSFEFDKDGKTENVSLPSGKTFFYIYDSIGRTKFRTLNLNSAYTYDTEYKYKDGYAGSTTSLVSSIKNGTSEIKYTYDYLGRIETIDNGKVIKYYYDSLGQVVREDNGEINKTIAYTYDQSGNILKVTEYALTSNATLGTATKTVNYGYGDSNWKDKLTSYNGKAITYDAIGNPLTYDGYTFRWETGRSLKYINGKGKNIEYKYNIDGIRTEKTVNRIYMETPFHIHSNE